jgi:hypothetical protein
MSDRGSLHSMNPFDAICNYCQKTLAVHSLKGSRAVCDDGHVDGFKLWQVIDGKRALGHKISLAQSYAAMKSRSKS